MGLMSPRCYYHRVGPGIRGLRDVQRYCRWDRTLGWTTGLQVRAYGNSDHAYVVWKSSAKIDGCLGFALVRKGPQGKEETLQTWVGFDDDPQVTPGTTG